MSRGYQRQQGNRGSSESLRDLMSPESAYSQGPSPAGHGHGHDHSHQQPHQHHQSRHSSGNASYHQGSAAQPQQPRVVTIQHQDGQHPHYPEQDMASASRPSGDYNNPFGQSYEIPYSPHQQHQQYDMPAPRPYQSQPRNNQSFSDQQLLGYQGGSGLVRKISTRVQQAIEAVKVPYQPVYPATVDEEGGYPHGRGADLHGELRDEWEMAPVNPETRPLNYPYSRGADDIKDADADAKPEDFKTELTDDEKYLVSYSVEDTRHPYNWPARKKYGILLVLCMAAVCVTATSSIQASTYNSIEREFNLSRPEAVLGVSLYVLGLGLGSLFLGPMSEFFGRAYIYLISFFLFTICNIPIATARSGGVFLFFRLLTGLCGSGFLSIAGGSVADMFRPGTVDIPMALYTLAPLVGPCLGPLLGGFINQNTTFRVTFYTVIGWSGVTLVLLWFFVPETFLPKILQRAATKKRLETGDGKWYAPLDRSARAVGDVFPSAMWQPIEMMVKEPMALILNCWTALVLGVIYLFFNAVPFTFRTVYGFDLQTCGLCFIPMALGMTIGTACQWFFIRNVRDKAIRAGGKAPPEARLPVGMAGALIVPIGLLWFSLSSFPEMTFFMPLVGILIFGVGSVFVFTCVWGFLVASFPKYAASAMAGNTLVRCIWAAGFPLFADPMYRGLGAVRATGVLAGAAAAMAPIPFVLYFFGSRWRSQSMFSK